MPGRYESRATSSPSRCSWANSPMKVTPDQKWRTASNDSWSSSPTVKAMIDPYESVGDVSTRLRERTLSPVTLVDACLARIDALNPFLNAFITVVVDEARDAARIAESEIDSGRWRGSLHGVPVAVKDFYDTAGIKTTAGFESFAKRIPAKDADVVDRLKKAGAIVVGKTNMDALGMATTGLTSFYGPVKNPWNADYIAG